MLLGTCLGSSKEEDKEVLSSVLRKPQTLGGSKVVNYAPKEFKGIVGFKRFLQSEVLQIEYVRDKNVLGGFYILIKLPDKQALEEVKSP
jgi:hypothetical protein